MNKYEVVIVVYNTGNVDSLLKAVKIFHKNAIISNCKEIIKNCKKLILPGQGSFDYGMEQLNKLEIKKIIMEKVLNDNTPILGICLGMQLLRKYGYENNLKTEGLNLIEGEIKKIFISGTRSEDGFNMWIAKQIYENNSELYICQQGGGPESKKHDIWRNQDMQICDKYLSFGWNSKGNDKIISTLCSSTSSKV